MSDATLSRRCALSMVAVATAVALFAGCATARRGRAFDCSSSPNKNGPIVCVDVINSVPVPDFDRVSVWDQQGRNHVPTGQPVHIMWILRDRMGDLGITVQDKGCLEPPVCNQATCRAMVMRLPDSMAAEGEGGRSKTCRYHLTLDGKVMDPVVVVDPCCN